MDILSIDADTVVTFTGRACPGISKKALMDFLGELKRRGTRLVLDSKSLEANDILQLQPWLIKPNQEELSAYCGGSVTTLADAAQKAQAFAAVENVMVSMGEQGAVLLSGGQIYRATPPKIQAISTIGAGDSAIAGFLAAAAKGETPAQCLKNAVAYGTAACLTEGTLPPKSQDIARIYGQMEDAK